jgi:hypothetical protein
MYGLLSIIFNLASVNKTANECQNKLIFLKRVPKWIKSKRGSSKHFALKLKI